MATDWPATLKAPARCQFWLVHEGANPQSPYDASDEWTPRYAEWRAVYQWSVTTQAQALAIEGFFYIARGKSFELNCPNFRLGVVGTKSGAVTGSGSPGDNSISISGGSGTFAIGDIVRVANQSHERLHVVVGVSGTTGIDITPPLWFSFSGSVLHRGTPGAITDMRETMLLTSDLSGAPIFPSPGAANDLGLIESRAIELASSHRPPS